VKKDLIAQKQISYVYLRLRLLCSHILRYLFNRVTTQFYFLLGLYLSLLLQLLANAGGNGLLQGKW